MKNPSRTFALAVAVAAGLFSPGASAQSAGIAKPNLIGKGIVEGMPRGDKQEISVLTATLKPGDQTVFHTHRFPVTVYILQGTFTLELEGRPTVAVKAGESFVEPPNVRMTGFNRSTDEAMQVVIFYVSEPGLAFLDPAHH